MKSIKFGSQIAETGQNDAVQHVAASVYQSKFCDLLRRNAFWVSYLARYKLQYNLYID